MTGKNYLLYYIINGLRKKGKGGAEVGVCEWGKKEASHFEAKILLFCAVFANFNSVDVVLLLRNGVKKKSFIECFSWH